MGTISTIVSDREVEVNGFKACLSHVYSAVKHFFWNEWDEQFNLRRRVGPIQLEGHSLRARHLSICFDFREAPQRDIETSEPAVH